MTRKNTNLAEVGSFLPASGFVFYFFSIYAFRMFFTFAVEKSAFDAFCTFDPMCFSFELFMLNKTKTALL